MRDVQSRSFYCPKLDTVVTLIEYARCEPGCELVCGILSCSHQDLCAVERDERGEPIFPWGTCPACREKAG
ncbi:MAG: hypothetical protein JW821_18960 [Deltaproteobacteria bacterium]|nr:hypothetical protein [Deltaproteobacteria bacterium]